MSNFFQFHWRMQLEYLHEEVTEQMSFLKKISKICVNQVPDDDVSSCQTLSLKTSHLNDFLDFLVLLNQKEYFSYKQRQL